jgi:hypothetical protein
MIYLWALFFYKFIPNYSEESNSRTGRAYSWWGAQFFNAVAFNPDTTPPGASNELNTYNELKSWGEGSIKNIFVKKVVASAVTIQNV